MEGPLKKLATRASETLGSNSNRRRPLDPNQDYTSSSTGRESLNQFVRVILGGIFTLCLAEGDDKKWVWNENNRNSNAQSGRAIQNPKSRYNVFEETDDYTPIGGNQYFPNQALPINQRPVPNYQNRPPLYQNRPPSGVGFIPEQRPGGVHGNGQGPAYGGQSLYAPQQEHPGILTGPVPSWLKEAPIQNFDKCKCTEKFNCNTPGISYGHCDAGKQYCCYSTKKQIGGPISSQPIHSIENGVLVGPGGPVDPIPGINAYPRPPKQIGGGFYRPGGFQGSQGSIGGNFYGGRPGGYAGYKEGPNEYSPANGILVGPGGPYDGNNAGFGRSAKSNIKADQNAKE